MQLLNIDYIFISPQFLRSGFKQKSQMNLSHTNKLSLHNITLILFQE